MREQEASDDAVMTRIGQAVILLHGGDREEARNRFGALWSEIGASADAFRRCALAHYLADAQDDPGDELAWDLRALAAADGGGAGAAIRAFYPALHLNLAADYLKLQRPGAARIHLDRAREAMAALGDGGHGPGVRTAVERLERRLAEAEEC
ncbi:hypothetical protein [Streptomyces clavuligerus]|nr:hypothetical protein [Streptomyces clavuligerus]ANW21230.1 hypothetical protein BB341_24990 [Streptomyces clavuligerus]AXU15856.1 hypothetical protein D1794_25960 [Streptomyces clavuligerus]MBY6305979.1 hypothetical protein [Streptomyces clavuligerus]QCS08637.1 hypothetical protein CRV15_25330 [Streptomyces clavuligerus]QPJ92028.1 hypothetical protein GE265_02810 [Streptomyces clavuligerus]